MLGMAAALPLILVDHHDALTSPAQAHRVSIESILANSRLSMFQYLVGRGLTNVADRQTLPARVGQSEKRRKSNYGTVSGRLTTRLNSGSLFAPLREAEMSSPRRRIVRPGPRSDPTAQQRQRWTQTLPNRLVQDRTALGR